MWQVLRFFENCSYMSESLLGVLTTVVVYQKSVLCFLTTMFINLKNYSDNLWLFDSIFNDCIYSVYWNPMVSVLKKKMELCQFQFWFCTNKTGNPVSCLMLRKKNTILILVLLLKISSNSDLVVTKQEQNWCLMAVTCWFMFGYYLFYFWKNVF
jgi:hypothetical protein